MSIFEMVVQQDLTVLVHDSSSRYTEIRPKLQRFATLIKHPAGIHTFKMTPLTLWNAAAAGMCAKDITDTLEQYASWPIPTRAKQEIALWMGRYGLFILVGEDNAEALRLNCSDQNLLTRFIHDSEIGTLFSGTLGACAVSVPAKFRGRIKKELARIGYPVIDQVGYQDGEPLVFALAAAVEDDAAFQLRDYQQEAVTAFTGGADKLGGDGVIVLPCGAGKTVVGIGTMAQLQSETLILTSNTTSVKQWKREILEKTTLADNKVGEYTGQSKEVRPITIATYQMMTYRHAENEEFVHMRLFHERNWGLIIYDEVHLLPAPVFRTTADLQATRRLGLTATLVREDGCEQDVFSLIGPKRYELPWRQLEEAGWIAKVSCAELLVPMSAPLNERYIRAELREKARLAGENIDKLRVIKELLARHNELPTLIIGQYLDQLRLIAAGIQAPLLTGSTPQEERQRLYQQFRNGEIHVLVVSKVANFAVDLPDATIAIQVSGSYGSRQEEAQRLGRLLRPKSDGRRAYFYTLVSEHSKEQEYAMKRQLFLIEQGYQYDIVKEEQLHEYGTAACADS